MAETGGDCPASASADDDVIRGTRYRVYMVGRDGRFLGPAKELECADDEEIVAKAMRMGSGVDLEIWDDTRLRRLKLTRLGYVAGLPFKSAATGSGAWRS
jgi:hypothetical protein